MAVPELLAIAFRHHQEGRLLEAEHIYRQVLLSEPRNVDALLLMGIMAYGAGQQETAISYLKQAIAVEPSYAEVHYNLANAFYEVGRLDDAVACYRRATQLKPRYVEAQFAAAAREVGLRIEARADGLWRVEHVPADLRSERLNSVRRLGKAESAFSRNHFFGGSWVNL